MGVDVRVAVWMREQGHDAVHLREQGLSRLPDREIFAKGIAEDRTIVTFDLDFSEITALSRRADVRVVSLRISDATATSVIRHLDAVLADCVDEPGPGWIVTVEDARHRIRRLPIGRES